MGNRERELFEYRDGRLYWRVSPNNWVTVGQEAGSLDTRTGYRSVQYDRKIKRTHRVIWSYHYGEIREGLFIDHINRDKLDNRIENLRLCSNRQNQGNSKLRVDNKTGFKGVSLQGGKFLASIKYQGKKIHLGFFDTAEEAHAAYVKAAKMVFGEFACGGDK